ncbi:MAG: ribosome-associated translation inhibitor RaiA [Bdellovibrionales bacterium]|nr:ribosome-associated translation inhibitor RaiA [Bdellovibrionales bacterium]
MKNLEDSVISEDFPLTDAIKAEVQSKIEYIEQHTNKAFPINVYLSKEGKNFVVKFRAHVGKKDIEVSHEDEDFYVSLNKAKQHFMKRINDQKEREVAKRTHK